MKVSHPIRIGRAAIWAALIFIAGHAWAQPASRLAPSLALPQPPENQSQPQVPITGLKSSPNIGGLDPNATVRGVQLENIPTGEEDKCHHLTDAFTGRQVTVAEAVQLAVKIERILAQDGYILAKVIIVPDKNNQDILHIHVVDGFIESLSLAHVPRSVHAHVRGILTPLVGRNWLKSSELVRKLSLLNQIPATRLSARLVKGNKFGAAILEVSGESQTIQQWVSVDNQLNSHLSPTNQVIGVALSNVLGRTDRLVLQISGDISNRYFGSHPIYRALAGDFSTEIGTQGLVGQASYVSVLSVAPARPNMLKEGSQFERATIAISYPALLGASSAIHTTLSLDASTDRSFAAYQQTLNLSLDKTRVVRWHVDFTQDRILNNGSIQLSLTHSVGLDAFGARNKSQVNSLEPLSRQGADDRFFKSEASVAVQSYLPQSQTWRLEGRLQGQWSFRDAMLQSEQVSFSDPNLLSLSDLGDARGDAGFAARMELQKIIKFKESAITPYGFISGAETLLEKPTALENSTSQFMNAGIGVCESSLILHNTTAIWKGEVGWISDPSSRNPSSLLRVSFSLSR